MKQRAKGSEPFQRHLWTPIHGQWCALSNPAHTSLPISLRRAAPPPRGVFTPLAQTQHRANAQRTPQHALVYPFCPYLLNKYTSSWFGKRLGNHTTDEIMSLQTLFYLDYKAACCLHECASLAQ